MTLARLLSELQPLLEAPAANWPRIAELLATHRDLAEYEVARFYATQALEKAQPSGSDGKSRDLPLAVACRDIDPRVRRRAASAIGSLCTRSTAARLLRPLVKDMDARVRNHARAVMHTLHIDDVALPDARFKPPARPRPGALGGWNVTGWGFGLFPTYGAWQRVKRTSKMPQAAQRERNGLPELRNVPDVRKWLGLPDAKALRRLMRPGAGTGAPYVEFQIEKSTGGTRTISAPRPALKKIQRRILDEILARIAPHEASHGFVPARSTVTNARPHVGARLVVKTDLRDFFPTIHYRRVVGLFCYYGYSPEVAGVLAGLTTHRAKLADGTTLWPGVLPQGAPTSPALANILCKRLDSRLSGLAKRAGAVYTRYADDLTFSFQAEPAGGVGAFLWWVDQICQQEGFTENAPKRRVLRGKNQQRVTGVVVNAGLSIPREARRQFRATLHNCQKHGMPSQARERKDFAAYLLGFASYVKMVQPALGSAWLREVKALIQKAKFGF